MFDIGTTEIIIIAVVIVLLFGSKKIPELAKGLGEGIRHLRNAFKDTPEDATVADSSTHNISIKKR